ncbi:MAG: 2-dehydropantoate 2-reductase [Firmicutes bacterium HGW-Firmicutes-15]|nr:MAG: 2-dehydropantoate 2-reductase [Firmicutes bacterium HGW-Firmicutes-15]
MNILVFGLGALGTVYSCLLKEQGHQVSGLDREAVLDAIQEKGVRVNGIWGEHSESLDELLSEVGELAGKDYDLLILTVKSYETEEVARQIARVISPNTYVLLAQNGYGNFEAAAKYISEARLILGRVIFGAETTELGMSKVTVIADDVVLGSPANLVDAELLETYAGIFNEAGIPTRTSTEVMKYVWGKIIYNSALNPLGAILEVPYGKLAANENTRALMDSIIQEIFAVLSAHGQETLWRDCRAYRQTFYGQMVPTTAQHHSSMLQDIQRGRKTEIDALNGAVVKLGKRYGVSTPVNEVIISLLRSKEEMRD